MAQERADAVTFKGNPLTLVGPALKVGDKAPAYTLVNNDLEPVKLADSAGTVRLLTVVPSLDTPVCDTMVRQFNQQAAELPETVTVQTVSVDLPFAQARWCGNAGIERVKTLSDYQTREFGTDYGLLIKELQLLARAVIVIDRDDTIQYMELVNEVTDEPDYASALKAASRLA